MKKKKGFTLIETAIVVLIVAILILLAVSFSSSANISAKIKALQGAESLISNKLYDYYSFYGRLPSNQTDFDNFLHDRRFFTTYPQNPFLDNGNVSSGWIWTLNSNGKGGILVPCCFSYANKYSVSFDLGDYSIIIYNKATRNYGGDR